MAIEAPKTQRDQLLAFGAFAALAAIGGFYMYVWSPKNEDLAKIQTRIDTLSAQNELARAEIARGTATKLKAEAEEYGRMLTLMRTLVPRENEVTALIDDISTAARRTGLELGNLAAPTIITGDIFDTYKYKLSISGPYHKVSQFFTNVASMPRIVAPTNVSLMPLGPSAKMAVHAGEQNLDVQFELQTYVAKGGKGIQ